MEYARECLPQAQEIITDSGFFYDVRNQAAWDLLNSMDLHLVDSVSISQKSRDLKYLGPQGPDYISECIDKGFSAAYLPNWLAELQDKHTARKLISTLDEIKASVMANGQSIGSLLDMAESRILKIRPQQRDNTSIKELVSQAQERFDQKYLQRDGITGLSTGFADLDKMTDGMHVGEMIVIAALSSRGKSALALNICTPHALAGTSVLVLTAEMTPVQQVIRSLCASAKVNFHQLNEHSIPKINAIASKMTKAAFFLQNASGYSISQINAVARRISAKNPIRLIMVDHVQLLKSDGDTREQELNNIALGCKRMAMELNCTVLALSQVNDNGQLKAARAIGEHADSVWTIHNKGEWQPVVQPVELRVEKCRDGATGVVELNFLKCYTKFETMPKINDEDVPL